jgi:cytidine deaminase
MKHMLTDAEKHVLIHEAHLAQELAYAPYSNYAVGAALLTRGGDIYTGCNIENAVFPLTLCAERVAVFKAVSDGKMDFNAIAVVTRNGGTPCGSCRQVLREFGQDIIVLVANELEELTLETTLGELLPHSFGSEDVAS